MSAKKIKPDKNNDMKDIEKDIYRGPDQGSFPETNEERKENMKKLKENVDYWEKRKKLEY